MRHLETVFDATWSEEFDTLEQLVYGLSLDGLVIIVAGTVPGVNSPISAKALKGWDDREQIMGKDTIKLRLVLAYLHVLIPSLVELPLV